MKKILLSLLAIICSVSMMADTAVLKCADTDKLNTLSDANGIVTLTDAASKQGIQKGSTTIQGVTCMKLSGSRQFNLTYSSSVTVKSVKLYAITNGTTAATVGTSSDDKDSYGTLDVKGGTVKEITLTGVSGEGLYFTSQSNAVIEVTYSTSDPSITASDATIKATESGVAATTDVTVTGANLTGSTLTATLSPAVDGLSVSLASNAISSGAIETTATLSYTATENVPTGTTTLTFSDGTTSKAVTVTYSAKVGDWTQQNVTEATTWDWSKAGAKEVKLTDETTPEKDAEVLLANIDGINNNADFKSDALLVSGEYMVRDTKYFQGGYIKFTTTVPGTVTVTFSNTGTDATKNGTRYLNVNGNNTVFSSSDATLAASKAIPVAVGEVTIKGVQASTGADAYLRISKIVFTPADLETKTLGTNGYSTHCSDYAYTATGATVYKATYADSKVTLSPVTGVIPAGVGVVMKGDEGAKVTITPATEAAAEVTSDLTGVSSATTELTTTGQNYVLASNGTTTEFVQIGSYGLTDMLHKAYLNVPESGNSKISVVFDDDTTTAIKAIDAAETQVTKKVMVNGQLRIVTANGTFTAAGARVK